MTLPLPFRRWRHRRWQFQVEGRTDVAWCMNKQKGQERVGGARRHKGPAPRPLLLSSLQLFSRYSRLDLSQLTLFGRSKKISFSREFVSPFIRSAQFSTRNRAARVRAERGTAERQAAAKADADA